MKTGVIKGKKSSNISSPKQEEKQCWQILKIATQKLT